MFVCVLLRVTRTSESDGVGVLDEEEADPKMAGLGEPTVGVERVVYDDETGAGAIPAKPLPTAKSMSIAQRAEHDLTHLP